MPKKLSLLAGLGATLLALSLSACDPAVVPNDPREVWITVEIGPRGAGKATIYAPYASITEKGQLLALGAAVGKALFPQAHSGVAIEGNDGGADLAVVSVPDVFTPGPRPSVVFATDDLSSALGFYGITHYQLTVCGPTVPSTLVAEPNHVALKGCSANVFPAGAQTETIRLELQPRVVNVWPAIVLSCLALLAAITAGVAIALRRSRTWLPLGVSFAITAVVLAIATIVMNVLENPDNSAVAGRLAGFPLGYAQVAGVVALVVLIAGIALFAVARSLQAPTHPPSPASA